MSVVAVYDCMLFFRAVIRPSGVGRLFDLVYRGCVTLCLGTEVLAEIRDVLTRPKLVAKYINLAIEAGASYLVSTDLDLLDLMDQSTAEGNDFQKWFPGLRIVTPSAFESLVARLAP